MLDAFGEQDERQPDLEDAEIGNDGPVGDRPGFFDDGRNTDNGHHDAATRILSSGEPSFWARNETIMIADVTPLSTARMLP